MKKLLTKIMIALTLVLSINASVLTLDKPAVVYAHDLYVPYPGYLIKYNPTYYDPNVVLVQQHLNLSGFYLKEDGFFGSTTKQCVIWFQQDVNSARAAEGRTDFLTVDGIVGLKTWNALINDTAAE